MLPDTSCTALHMTCALAAPAVHNALLPVQWRRNWQHGSHGAPDNSFACPPVSHAFKAPCGMRHANHHVRAKQAASAEAMATSGPAYLAEAPSTMREVPRRFKSINEIMADY
jgi:hypothetical protein